jgi:hypothetical protein
LVSDSLGLGGGLAEPDWALLLAFALFPSCDWVGLLLRDELRWDVVSEREREKNKIQKKKRKLMKTTLNNK